MKDLFKENCTGKQQRRGPLGTAAAPIGGSFMTRIIEVLVSPKGETQIQAKGYAGCRF